MGGGGVLIADSSTTTLRATVVADNIAYVTGGGILAVNGAAPLIDGSMPLALQTDPLRLTGEGQPLRFRGNNAAVTGLMELQFDRFREIAGINRYGEPEDAAAMGSSSKSRKRCRQPEPYSRPSTRCSCAEGIA